MIDLFGQDSLPDSGKHIPGTRIAERLHKQLLAIYGKTPNTVCKHCIHLKRAHQGSKSWSKCAKATLEGHIATDWRVAWQACGKYETHKTNP